MKKNLIIITFSVLALALLATPARMIVAEPVIKIITSSTRYFDNLSSNGSDTDNNIKSNRSITASDKGESRRVALPSAKSIDGPSHAKSPSAIGDQYPQPAVTVKPVLGQENIKDVSEKNAQNPLPGQVSSEKQQVDKPAGIPSSVQPKPKVKQTTSAKEPSRSNLATKVDIKPDLAAVQTFRATYNNNPAHALVGRAIWYMKYGYMVYGHKKYWDTGYIDCSNFVSLVYKDFGYNITSAARKYDSVGQPVSGVYVKNQSGSSTKHVLMGIDNLKPGDIFTFWKEDSQGNRYIGHVALYMGKLNGKPTIIHTVKGFSTAIGITDSFTYWYGEHFNGVRRVLPSSAHTPGASWADNGPVIPAKYQMKRGQVVMPDSLLNGF